MEIGTIAQYQVSNQTLKQPFFCPDERHWNNVNVLLNYWVSCMSQHAAKQSCFITIKISHIHFFRSLNHPSFWSPRPSPVWITLPLRLPLCPIPSPHSHPLFLKCHEGCNGWSPRSSRRRPHRWGEIKVPWELLTALPFPRPTQVEGEKWEGWEPPAAVTSLPYHKSCITCSSTSSLERQISSVISERISI